MSEEAPKGPATPSDVDDPIEVEHVEAPLVAIAGKSVPPPVPSRPLSAPPLRPSLPDTSRSVPPSSIPQAAIVEGTSVSPLRPASIPPPLPPILPRPPKEPIGVVRAMRIIRIESSGQSLPPPPIAPVEQSHVAVEPVQFDFEPLADQIIVDEQPFDDELPLGSELPPQSGVTEPLALGLTGASLDPGALGLLDPPRTPADLGLVAPLDELEKLGLRPPLDELEKLGLPAFPHRAEDAGLRPPVDESGGLGLQAPLHEAEDLSGDALVLDSAPTHAPPEEAALATSRRLPPPPKRRSLTPAPSAKAVEKALHPPRSDRTAKKRNRVWWENLFTDDFARAILPLSDEQARAEVDFIERSLSVAKDGVILDLACGTGQHAVEYSRRGYNVIGYDLSVSQLATASELAQEHGLKMNFLQGDMREMAFESKFDGIYCWNTSFGYFEEEKNVVVAKHLFRALKSGGNLLLDVINRDFAVAQQPSQNWFEGDTCVCMDDMSVDFITSRLRVKRTIMLDDGRNSECSYSIRLYGLHELGKVLHDIGFKVIQASGQPAVPGVFLGACSPRVIILATKP